MLRAFRVLRRLHRVGMLAALLLAAYQRYADHRRRICARIVSSVIVVIDVA